MTTLHSKTTAILLASSWLALAGCGGEASQGPGESESQNPGTAMDADLSTNSLTYNSLTYNSLTFNSLTSSALTSGSLTAASLTSNPLTSQALEDAAARTVLGYIVSCALAAGTHFDLVVDGVTYGYDGQLGLAPTWGSAGGHCDNGCKTWVSGCVISRLNYLGQKVPISVRGEKLKTSPAEVSAYPNIDGTYYGDIFAQPQILMACLPPGATLLPRVCGPTTLQGCAVTVAGPCQQTCDAQKADGSFPNCRNEPKNIAGAKAYPGSVTVFLQ